MMWLNQFVSSSGYCSRRQADRLIKEKKVIINGKTALYGAKYHSGDIVEIDGNKIEMKKERVYLILNKPRGITCTAAAHIKGNIIDFVDYPERIFPIGRLDKETEGLILLTNDGGIVNDLLKSESQVEKDYLVTVNRAVTEDFLRKLATGVRIYNPREKDYTMTKPCKVIKQTDYQFKITLTQGLNRQIRRMCRRFQYTVTELERIRLKDITLGSLKRGEWRYLTEEEVAGLL